MAAPIVAWDSVAPADIVLRAADIPMLFSQAIPVAPTRAKWVDDTTGPQIDGGGVPTAGDITTWTDRTLNTAPASHAYDGIGGYVTQPSVAVVDDTWFLAFEFSAIGIIFDLVALLGHNFDTLTNGPLTTCQFQVADSANFQTNLRTIADFTLRGSDVRMADIALTHGAEDPVFRYKDVRYGWLKCVAAGNIVPAIGELVLGRSRQLEKHLLMPWDDLALTHTKTTTQSEDGIYTGKLLRQNQRDLIGKMLVSESAGVADMRAWYRQVRTTFGYLPEPNTADEDWLLMWLESEMRAPHAGYTSRILPIESYEQGPDRLYLDNEVN